MPTSGQDQYDRFSLGISRVLTPVMICMALSVWFVQSLGDPKSCKRLGNGRKIAAIALSPVDDSNSSENDSQYSSRMAGIFIAIFIVLMVVFTFLLVWLYKTGRSKYIVVWLMVAVFLIFAYVGGLYIFDFCRSRCINMDWITICLAVWNFTITGLFAVFGVVPRVINQGYLIVMSSLMAYIFRTLPSWAIWTILAALVVWDLFAVLNPRGPLKMLVEAARERDEPLPALVYDTNPMDIGRDESAQPTIVLNSKKKAKQAKQSKQTNQTAREKPPRRRIVNRRQNDASSASTQQPTETTSETVDESSNRGPRATTNTDSRNNTDRPATSTSIAVSPPGDAGKREDGASSSGNDGTNGTGNDANELINDSTRENQRTQRFRFLLKRGRANVTDATAGDGNGQTTATSQERNAAQENETEELRLGTMGAHLKLGLGDFVFYSILVSQASQSGAMTTVASFVAILAGLCATLFLVTIYKKALPALPISISVGLLFYFLTRFTVQPFIENMVPELLFY
ncbi:unnamed protein product [Chondrus crispus]|uniref:Presenilin n=1 Tax=Chondrus crispus TaxID=2769 RepID=R7QBX8_CHOCR|nr:unnamed protein product [Chondrus crispus]CDF35977.1 unnamed protein product [Chondrus crispus]|eukprot:XP_005715796.1 unnamed protein product [Chondrus crispus]